MPMIDIRDTKLYYEMTGDGDPALVFIPGMCCASWSFDEPVERLSPEFTCVAYDRRGHSRSEQGTGDHSDRTHTDDLAALIEALGLDRPIVVGASSGAVIAVEMMRSYPNIIRGAVLMEPPLLSVDPELSEQLMSEMVPVFQEAHAKGGDRGALDVFFHMICGRYWEDLDDDRRAQTMDNAHLLFPTLQRDAADITIADLETIETPALAIGGTTSPPFHRALNRTLADHLPDARFIEVEDCGHVVLGEKPDEFAQAVRAFAHEVAGALAGRSA